jgi:UDP-N-acetyl-D-glucosamine/UDP-N-acetyl-D-galactosamine dehydrogenase
MRTVCVVGLGYVGLPLAHAFAKAGYPVIGYDIAADRIAELQKGHDRTKELTDEQLRDVTIEYSADPAVLQKADVVILAIPTPVDEKNDPDLSLVESASRTVGKHLKKGTIVVYESTVYPGVTEELCGAILEEESGMKRGKDFFSATRPSA